MKILKPPFNVIKNIYYNILRNHFGVKVIDNKISLTCKNCVYAYTSNKSGFMQWLLLENNNDSF